MVNAGNKRSTVKYSSVLRSYPFPCCPRDAWKGVTSRAHVALGLDYRQSLAKSLSSCTVSGWSLGETVSPSDHPLTVELERLWARDWGRGLIETSKRITNWGKN